MAHTKSYRDLNVWQMGMKLAMAVYETTARFPLSELHSLTGQLRQAAVSIPAHTAEGFGLRTTADYVHFLALARGAAMRVETLLQVSHNLDYLNTSTFDDLLYQTEQLNQALGGLIESLRRRDRPPQNDGQPHHPPQ
ncbi:MAG: four helix bundle protein [Anaerolineae bacterium]